MSGQSRRNFLLNAARGVGGLALAGGACVLAKRAAAVPLHQIDPARCTGCGLCETACVLKLSAVKCVNDFAKCGYCEFCYGYYYKAPPSDDPQNLVCAPGAIIRRKVGDVQYEYTIDESKCNGCGKCVVLCKRFGNGSFRLEIRRDLCKECNRCSIGAVCPPAAIARLPYKRA